jgi:hypothetical protein
VAFVWNLFPCFDHGFDYDYDLDYDCDYDLDYDYDYYLPALRAYRVSTLAEDDDDDAVEKTPKTEKHNFSKNTMLSSLNPTTGCGGRNLSR